jgi:hypothetical protein
MRSFYLDAALFPTVNRPQQVELSHTNRNPGEGCLLTDPSRTKRDPKIGLPSSSGTWGKLALPSLFKYFPAGVRLFLIFILSVNFTHLE